MGDVIQLLPDHVANQIAAGEVVQRPASVVKELLENALDAGSENIEIHIRDAGRNLIQILDDGNGMSPTDARMAFERHATSKIRSSEDIFTISTKGFRGEALASIAAVAQVELRTRQADAPVGTAIYLEGSDIKFQEPCQFSPGTSISVKNLFYNVPARRKFLKNNSVEFRHIIDEFHRVALPHPDTAFDLFHNDEPVFRLRKGQFQHRILDIFGRKLQPALVPVQEDLGWVSLSGYVAKPEAAKKNRGEQFFFVNNRFFKSPYLHRAVQDAFEGLLLPGYSPSYFLLIEIPPEKIDVNIHPQKTEIKFEDENLIFALIRSTVKRALGIYNVAPSLRFDAPLGLESVLSSGTTSSSSGHISGGIQVPRDYNPFKDEVAGPLGSVSFPAQDMEPSKINLFPDEDLDEDLMRLPNGYWLYNDGERCLMIDPGRMHRLLVKESKDSSPLTAVSTPLLFSMEYHMSEPERLRLRQMKKYLAKVGFQLEIKHESTLLINSVPYGLNEARLHSFFERLFEITELDSEEAFLQAYQERWKASQARSRFDFLYKKDVEEVIKQFTKLGFPKYLPDGKRCYMELPLEEFKNKF